MHKSIHSSWSVVNWLHFEEFWEVSVVVMKNLLRASLLGNSLGNLAWLLPFLLILPFKFVELAKKKFNSFKYVVSTKSSFHKNWGKFYEFAKKKLSSKFISLKFVSFKYQCCKNMSCLINFATKIEAKLLF